MKKEHPLGSVGDEDEPPTTAFKQSAMKEKSDEAEEQLKHDMAASSAGGESNANSIDEQQAAVWDEDGKFNSTGLPNDEDIQDVVSKLKTRVKK